MAIRPLKTTEEKTAANNAKLSIAAEVAKPLSPVTLDARLTIIEKLLGLRK